MVETTRTAAVLLTLALIGGVLAWAVATVGLAVDVPAVLSLRTWRIWESEPSLTPAVLGESDTIGARPVEVVEDYPAVRLQRPQSVFAP